MNPPLDVPHESGMLDVGDGHQLYYALDGATDGIPLLYLHGGPGAPLRQGHLENVDLDTYRVVSLQQRGAGLSTPHASEPGFDLATVTTQRLVDDCEALREHLGIDSWLVVGISWGSTLALHLAVRNPAAVRGLLLVAVTTTSPDEVHWISEGARLMYPEAWDELARFVAAHTDWREDDAPIIDAVAELMAQPDDELRLETARHWLAWEDTHVAIGTAPERLREPGLSSWPDRDAVAFTTLVATTWSHHRALDPEWVGDRPLLEQLDVLADVPICMVHGRRDVSGPVAIPWRIKGILPHAELHVVEHEGHGGPTMAAIWGTATDCFAARGDFARIVDFL